VPGKGRVYVYVSHHNGDRAAIGLNFINTSLICSVRSFT
jgi:hypothetical protein